MKSFPSKFEEFQRTKVPEISSKFQGADFIGKDCGDLILEIILISQDKQIPKLPHLTVGRPHLTTAKLDKYLLKG